MKGPTLPVLLFIVLCTNSPSRAAWKTASSDAGQSKDSGAGSKMDVDKEVDNGADDDKNNEDTVAGRFKKDADDSYVEPSTGGDDWLKSRFKDGQDDVDTGGDARASN